MYMYNVMHIAFLPLYCVHTKYPFYSISPSLSLSPLRISSLPQHLSHPFLSLPLSLPPSLLPQPPSLPPSSLPSLPPSPPSLPPSLPPFLPPSLQGLGLLINMIEHNASNRQQLERLPVEYHILTTPTAPQGAEHTPSQQEGATTEVKGDESSQDDGCSLLKGRNTCIRSLISLFLKHYQNAEGATIEVHVHVYIYSTCTCTLYTSNVHVHVQYNVHVHVQCTLYMYVSHVHACMYHMLCV